MPFSDSWWRSDGGGRLGPLAGEQVQARKLHPFGGIRDELSAAVQLIDGREQRLVMRFVLTASAHQPADAQVQTGAITDANQGIRRLLHAVVQELEAQRPAGTALPGRRLDAAAGEQIAIVVIQRQEQPGLQRLPQRGAALTSGLSCMLASVCRSN